MEDFPFMTVAMCVPLAGAALAGLTQRSQAELARRIALVASLVTLGVVLLAATEFNSDNGSTYQLVENHNWISSFGVSYALGVDGIGYVMVLLTAVLMPIILLASWRDLDEGEHAQTGPGGGTTQLYVSMMLVLEAMSIGQFAALDVFLFYVLFEAMLIPMYILIGRFGGPQRQYAAVKFLLYNLLGGLLMLVAVVWINFAGPGGEKAYYLPNLVQYDFGTDTARWLFLGFFVAFAIKAPLWPFHTWLPDAMAEATPSNGVLLSGILDKVGVFGMLHLCLPLFPEAARHFAPAIVVLALISILYGAMVAIGQTDLKRLIAYASVSHFGFIVLGIFVMTSQGQSGATLYMVNHGFATAGLLLIAGFMMSRRGSRLISSYGGVQKVAPVLAGSFLFAGLANLSLPGLSPFISEFMVLIGTFTRYPIAGYFAVAGVLLAALYVLIAYQRTMTGELTEGNEDTPDLKTRELLVVTPVIAVILALGFFPKPLLDVIDPAVERTLTQVERTDPRPEHPVQVAAEEKK
ncbi:NADH-quinone oxidoreductase subunit M [Sporichthya sp.]|uniref:NADH-quinone oxidoreductase subunit M n=1 Tax=Sporichthya sp. TaxID=65475 RepID=UPI00185B3551|nr:NADH-quinone oxidoreductase subunit M [Sporichthya sp.]MBA3744257.1 NADH-quinone oxidoreductase subunit M [Sporichthya sp.]